MTSATTLPALDFSEAKARLSDVMTAVIRERQPRLVTWRGRGRPPKNAIRITVPSEDGVKRRRPVVLYALVVDGDPAAAADLLQRQAV